MPAYIADPATVAAARCAAGPSGDLVGCAAGPQRLRSAVSPSLAMSLDGIEPDVGRNALERSAQLLGITSA